MTDGSPTRALNVVRHIEGMCNFIEDPAIKTAVEQAVPCSMPRTPGALGFDVPLWVGLGIVGLWAALDAFADRAGLTKSKCPTCGRRSCIWTRFAPHPLEGNEGRSLEELEDFRHLYAHNYAGEADAGYFGRPRHILARGTTTALTCGVQFSGHRLSLDLPHLRYYASTVKSVLARLP